MFTALFFLACATQQYSSFVEQMHVGFEATFIGEHSLDRNAIEVGSGSFQMSTPNGEKKTSFYAYAWAWDPCAPSTKVITIVLDQEADKLTANKWLGLINEYPATEGEAYFQLRTEYVLARPDGASVEWIAPSDHEFNVINLPIGKEKYSKEDLEKILHRAFDHQVECKAIRDVQYAA